MCTGKPNGAAAEPASEEEVLAARVARHDVLLLDNVAIHRGGGLGTIDARSFESPESCDMPSELCSSKLLLDELAEHGSLICEGKKNENSLGSRATKISREESE